VPWLGWVPVLHPLLLAFVFPGTWGYLGQLRRAGLSAMPLITLLGLMILVCSLLAFDVFGDPGAVSALGDALGPSSNFATPGAALRSL